MNARAQSKHPERPANAGAKIASLQADNLRRLVRAATGGKSKMLDRLLSMANLPNLRSKLNGPMFFDAAERQALLDTLGVGIGFVDGTEDMFGNPVTAGQALVHPFFTRGDEDAGYRLKQALRQSSHASSPPETLLALAPDGVADFHDAEYILDGAKPLGYLAAQEVLAALKEEDIDVPLHKLLGLPRPISTAALKSPASMAATAALKKGRGKRETLVPPQANGVDDDKGETVAPLIDLLPTVEEALALPVTVAEADSSARTETADAATALDVGTTTETLDVAAAEPEAEVLLEPAAKDDTATLLVNAMAAEAAQEQAKALAAARAELVTLRQQLETTTTARDQALALVEETMRSLSESRRHAAAQEETLARVQAEAEAREHKLAEFARNAEAAVEAREEAMARATGLESNLHAMSTQVTELKSGLTKAARALRKAEAEAERSEAALDTLRRAQAQVPARPTTAVKAPAPVAKPAMPKERRWAYAYPGGVPFRVKRAMKRQG